jgi:sarcosine oxidase subunit gamma
MPDRGQSGGAALLRIARIANMRCAVLRIRSESDVFLARAADVLRAPLPTEPNRCSREALWLAPGEWLLVGSNAAEDRLALLSHALARETFHIADVTHGRAVFSISGSQATDFIARGCGLDLHRSVFPVDACAQSLFAQIPALLHHFSDEPAFHLYVDASYESYLRSWMQGVVTFFSGTELL